MPRSFMLLWCGVIGVFIAGGMWLDRGSAGPQLTEEIARPDFPDPTFEMVDDQWATLKIPGYRQSWGKPSMVSRMVVYEPGQYLPGEKEYAVFWWIGQTEYREDFHTREDAIKLVEFILANSKVNRVQLGTRNEP